MIFSQKLNNLETMYLVFKCPLHADSSVSDYNHNMELAGARLHNAKTSAVNAWTSFTHTAKELLDSWTTYDYC